MENDAAPNHVQQLQQLASLLQKGKAESDSVTWVPELIPIYVQKAVEAVLAPADSPYITGLDSTDPTTSTPAGTATAAPTAPAAALAVGFQHLQVSSSSKRPVDWVMTTCLVPEGLPTAAAAEEAGGLATMEVVCRLVMLQDCQPAEVSAAFTKALSKVKWQQYGLQYSDFFSCDDNTGILTLAVLPEAMMVPLSLIVCSCNIIEAPQDAPDTDAAAADQDSTLQTQDLTQANITSAAAAAAARSTKRRRGGSSRAPCKPPSLSLRREIPLWIGALEAALASLKSQLPEGYMRGRHEALLATALPPIAASLASIITSAANAGLREESCSVLECEPAELQETLLAQLQELAADALAQKTSAAAQQQQQQRRQTQQPVDVAAAAAALLGAGAEEGGSEDEGGHEDHGVSQQGQPTQQQQQQLCPAEQWGLQQQRQQQPQWPASCGTDSAGSGAQGLRAGMLGPEGFEGCAAPDRSLEPRCFDKKELARDSMGGAWDTEQQQEGGAAVWDFAQQQQHLQQQWPGSAGGWEDGQEWQQPGCEQQHHQQRQQQQLFGGAAGWEQQAEDPDEQELWQPSEPAQQQQQQPGGWGLLGPATEQQQEHVLQGNTSQPAAKAGRVAAAAAAAAAGGGGGSGATHDCAPTDLGTSAAMVAGVVGVSSAPVPASRRRMSGSVAAHLF